MTTRDIVKDRRDEYAFHDDIVYLAETKRGLTQETVEEISRFKDEPSGCSNTACARTTTS